MPEATNAGRTILTRAYMLKPAFDNQNPGLAFDKLPHAGG
jgi:hypothetical protein